MEWLFLSIVFIAIIIDDIAEKYFEYKAIKELKELYEEDKQC